MRRLRCQNLNLFNASFLRKHLFYPNWLFTRSVSLSKQLKSRVGGLKERIAFLESGQRLKERVEVCVCVCFLLVSASNSDNFLFQLLNAELDGIINSWTDPILNEKFRTRTELSSSLSELENLNNKLDGLVEFAGSHV